MTTVYERRTAPPVAPAPRRSPAGAVLGLLWAGAAGAVALWWADTGSVVGAAGWLTGIGYWRGCCAGTPVRCSSG